MDKLLHGGDGEAQVEMDLLASVWVKRSNTPASKSASQPERLPLRIYALMLVTSLMTFAMLSALYQLLFSQQVFA